MPAMPARTAALIIALVVVCAAASPTCQWSKPTPGFVAGWPASTGRVRLATLADAQEQCEGVDGCNAITLNTGKYELRSGTAVQASATGETSWLLENAAACHRPGPAPAPSGGLAKTPPMGWMSWEIFRCNVDCKDDPDNCIGAELYKSTADALAAENADGSSFLKAGFNTIHIDDCWETKTPPRDPATGRLVPNATRFPEGISGLADYVHGKGVQFGIYSDEGTHTCQGYPGSKGHEKIDAQTFSDWGVDYLKLDGCNNNRRGFAPGYLAMGEALRAAGQRPIVYSCSWPAYLGSDENTKPFALMAAAGCNLWRNWHDIQCNWNSLASIIDHWGDYGPALQRAAAPGHWNDPDILLIGNDCITDDEAETQMAMWSLFAAPLIMGNDARKISTPRARATLLNAHAIAVDQDPLGKQGLRVTKSSAAATQVFARELANGDVAVGLYNKLGGKPADITVAFADLPGLRAAAVDVFDIWAGKSAGTFVGNYTAKGVALHGTAFLRLSVASSTSKKPQ